MRKEEADWIAGCLRTHVLNSPPDPGHARPVVLHLGSGDVEAQKIQKPWIHARTIAPLEQAGFEVVHSDLRPSRGVDLVGDLTDPAFHAVLRRLQPRLVYCCNVLEHLPRNILRQIPGILASILGQGAYLLITVPLSYPYHADPIDTMYRPNPEQLASFFPGFRVVDKAVVDSETYGEEFRKGSFTRRARKVLRPLFPFVRPRRWLSHVHRFFWLRKPYRHSCILLQRCGPDGS
jgi:hypothetical protein